MLGDDKRHTLTHPLEQVTEFGLGLKGPHQQGLRFHKYSLVVPTSLSHSSPIHHLAKKLTPSGTPRAAAR